MKFNLLVAFVAATLSLNIMAHEGHSDTSLKSLHGGIVKKTSNSFIEVVQEEGKTEIFVTGHDYKNIVDSKLAIKASAETKGKNLPLDLAIEKDHYLVTTDLKKEKHFKLNVFIKNAAKEDKASFALENQ
ncbi:MAG: hypothetical protein PHY93_16910 [Bacteriovorax sp.]|nr:hypothetical protein [Bacteriovorax sp.]